MSFHESLGPHELDYKPSLCPICGQVHDEARMKLWLYLPMDCPNCGRQRLEYNGYHAVCDNCRIVDWQHPSRGEENTSSPDYPYRRGACGDEQR